MGHYVEDYPDFERRHGKAVNVDGQLLFADGATADAFNSDIRHEPPADSFKRLKNQRDYWQERLTRVSADFAKLRLALKGMGRFRWEPKVYGESHGSGPADLRHLGTIVKSCQQQIAEIDSEIRKTPQMVEKRRMQRVNAEMANDQLLAELEASNEADEIAAELGIS